MLVAEASAVLFKESLGSALEEFTIVSTQAESKDFPRGALQPCVIYPSLVLS